MVFIDILVYKNESENFTSWIKLETKFAETTFLVNNEMFDHIRELLMLKTDCWEYSIFMGMSYYMTVKSVSVQVKMKK